MAKVQLGGNADAVEFCPSEAYLQILAAASYTLQEGQQGEGGSSRLGGLYLFSVDCEEGHPTSSLGLTKLYHRETPGVFDIKWRPYDDGCPCLAQASADGSLSLHMLKNSPESSLLELEEKAGLVVSSSMCLYVDWNPLHSEPEVAVSHSDGSISLVDLGQSEPEVSASWQAHGFETWVVAYDFWKTVVIYSGGDDCQFCCWDSRQDLSRPVFRNKKSHTMGVTSIQSNALWENMVITGSYDENVRLFDVRMAQKPLLKAELGLGGGVWRLKWHHTKRDILLAACMHNGAAIARVGEGGFQILEQYKEHTSLTYGASWYRGELRDALDPRTNVLEGDKGMEHSGENRCSSPVVANPVPDDAKQNLQPGRAMEMNAAGEPSLAAESVTKWDNDDEARLSVQFSQTGLENSIRMKLLVSTCSFYDRSVHLWRPKTFTLGPR